jgi:hypothetical protein
MGRVTRAGTVTAVVVTLLLRAAPAGAQGSRYGIGSERAAVRPGPVTTFAVNGVGSAIGRERTLWFALGGAALGAVACTAISNYVKDSGSGFTTCTASGYAAFVAGGALTGVVVALLTDHPASGS